MKDTLSVTCRCARSGWEGRWNDMFQALKRDVMNACTWNMVGELAGAVWCVEMRT